nr:uncharacterized protein LOC115256015 [Aedes albopictus]
MSEWSEYYEINIPKYQALPKRTYEVGTQTSAPRTKTASTQTRQPSPAEQPSGRPGSSERAARPREPSPKPGPSTQTRQPSPAEQPSGRPGSSKRAARPREPSPKPGPSGLCQPGSERKRKR